ncbi:GntR family transcriptional regulator [Methylovirgula ligni]|uniref:GntR family transcriptional regulator n=1 Tax=Methylovirgula ligni TaxID=569860 RepID=A0A3D9Z4K8_9HYPH|nr:GntR family transcriptional regulator [Methylovirgula ligni]REF89170.1 GntR family transcriptional regulator [Methylovirgula ligni]
MLGEAVTVTENVIARLRERVLDGTYAPGARLQEFALANDLEVSRTPIRDALRVLASEELLIYAPNRGYAVRNVVLQDVIDAYDVRANLEGLACRLLAERGISDALLAQFDKLIARGEEIVNGPDWGPRQHQAWSELNTEFHTTIAVATRNKSLEEILRQVRRIPRMFDSRLSPNTDFFRSVYTHEERKRSHREHTKIVEALRVRDALRAEALMREHVYVNRDLLRKTYEEMFGAEVGALEQTKKKRRRKAEA